MKMHRILNRVTEFKRRGKLLRRSPSEDVQQKRSLKKLHVAGQFKRAISLSISDSHMGCKSDFTHRVHTQSHVT
jgi:hypothetical protein